MVASVQHSAGSSIEAVVFDLGGVLVDFVGLERLATALDLPDTAAAGARWLRCAAVRRFERGLCDPEQYATDATRELELPWRPERFLEEFERWVTDPLPGALDLLEALRGPRDRGLTTACLSNTNELHASRLLSELRSDAHFDHVFLSCRTGQVKPDREAFEHCTTALGLDPRSVLLLDDQPLNVQGARDAGLRAEQVTGPASCRALLKELGVLRESSPPGPLTTWQESPHEARRAEQEPSGKQ